MDGANGWTRARPGGASPADLAVHAGQAATHARVYEQLSAALAASTRCDGARVALRVTSLALSHTTSKKPFPDSAALRAVLADYLHFPPCCAAGMTAR